MKKLLALLAALCLVNPSAFAQTPGPSCAEKAVSKSGKPLAGAARNAFMKKCEKDNPAAAPAAAPAPAPVAGKSTQQDKMKRCNAEAKGKQGDDRKAFMKTCLSN